LVTRSAHSKDKNHLRIPTAFLRAQSTVKIVLGGAGKSDASAGLSMALRNFSRRAFSPAGQPILINWRRGLVRLWLLVSAGWVMGWTIYLVMYSLQGGYNGNRDFVAIPVLLLAPPLAFFVFGLATGWAFRGFQAEHQDQSPKQVRESRTKTRETAELAGRIEQWSKANGNDARTEALHQLLARSPRSSK
jgi:hypothetical protein